MIIAGVPNYTGLFGRDAYVTSLQTAASRRPRFADHSKR